MEVRKLFMELKNLNSLKSYDVSKLTPNRQFWGVCIEKWAKSVILQKHFENSDFAPIYGHFKFDFWPFSQFSAKISSFFMTVQNWVLCAQNGRKSTEWAQNGAKSHFKKKLQKCFSFLMDSPILLKIHMKQVHRSTKKTFFVFLGNFKQIFCIVAIFGPKMAQKSQKNSKSQKSKTMLYLPPLGGGVNY